MERFRPFAAVYVLLVRDGEVFLNRRYQTGFMDGYYDVPGDHLDGDEKLPLAAAREGMEETGAMIDPADLTLAHICHRWRHDREYIDFFFEAKKWIGEPTNAEPDKSDHADWFSFDNLPEMTNPHMRSSIGNWQKGLFYSEFGWQ